MSHQQYEELRGKYIFMQFMTDPEVENLLSVIRSVAAGTSVKEEEILISIEEQSQQYVARA